MENSSAEFKLEQFKLVMAPFKYRYLFLLYTTSYFVTSCMGCQTTSKELIEITNGTKYKDSIVYKDITFTSRNYFENDGKVYGCICNVRTCLPKCCKQGKRRVNGACRYFNNNLTLAVYKGTEKSQVDINSFHFIKTKMMCDGQQIMLTPDIEYYVQENGHLHTSIGNYVDRSTFCLEGTDTSEVIVVVCVKSEEIEEEDEMMEMTKYTGMIISMPFLLATFLVYALLPDRNLPAKALMCYVLSLLFAYILLVTIQLNAGHKATTCISLAFFCYYFFMASFFWMNASCLDIFFTFSGIRGLLGDKKKEHKRFAYYSAYAWGVPLLMVGFASIFTFAYTDANNSFYTGLGQGQCWFRNGWATGIYFYFPIAILLIVNMVLFGVTTYKIKRVQKDTKMLKNVDSRKHKYDNNDKQRFNLYVKLLFAMGINWSMEVISWAIMWKWANVPDYVWVLTDFCNAVYGVFIFFIFVFKRNIWMLLKKRYLQLTGRPQQAHNLTSTHRTTMTTSLSSLSKSLERKITPTCMQYNNQIQN